MPSRLLIVILSLIGTSFAPAQADLVGPAPLKVGVKHSPPFVIVNEASGQLTGFSIDLMRMIATQLSPARKVEFQIQDELATHLDEVRSGRLDLGIAATTLSSHRERELDFSQPFFSSGLDIAIRPEGGSIHYWDILLSPQILFPFLWMTLFLVACANIIWYTERGEQEFSDNWLLGVGQASWWTVVTMTTVGYGDFVPRKPLSRVIGVLIIMSGIVLFGVVVGAFSSVFTLEKLATDIRGPEDLKGRAVAVVKGTVAMQRLQDSGANLLPVANLSAAINAVTEGTAFAAVHDFPQLHHYLKQHPQELLLVDRPFAKQGYAIAFPLGSPLRKQVNVALLQLMEGTPSPYWELHARWFERSL